jgi:DNA-binding NarL/FixJ family response regulator
MALAEREGLDGIRVLVHSHARLLRDGVSRLLDETFGISVVARTHRACELDDTARRVAADVVVVHVDLLDVALIPAIERLRSGRLPVKIVAVGAGIDAAQWGGARQSSIDAFVPASANVEALVAAILGDGTPSTGGQPATLPRLSAREQDVLELVGAGLRAREISERLGITTKTVENHKQRIYAKLDARNQAHAVTIAVRGGLLRDGIDERFGSDG